MISSFIPIAPFERTTITTYMQVYTTEDRYMPFRKGINNPKKTKTYTEIPVYAFLRSKSDLLSILLYGFLP